MGLRVDRNMKNDSDEIFRPNFYHLDTTTTQADTEEATEMSSVRKLRVRYIDRQQAKANQALPADAASYKTEQTNSKEKVHQVKRPKLTIG